MRTETITYKIYPFEELDDKAKEKARDWFKEDYPDYEWWDYTYDRWKEDLTEIGFNDPDFSFSGFCCQGDGASFTADLDLDKLIDCLMTCDPAAYKYRRLIGVQSTELTWPFWEGPKVIRTDSHYCHENTVRTELYLQDAGPRTAKLIDELQADIEALRYTLCRKLYRELEAEYDHMRSNEHVDETITINEYEFTEDGKIYP
jgi:hypothetical protein